MDKRAFYYRLPGHSLENATAFLGQHWGWVLFAGLSYIAVGIISLSIPVASTFGLTIVLAGLLAATGLIQFVHAIEVRHQQGAIMRFAQALLALAIALLVFVYPGLGMLGISFAIGAYFFLSGVSNWMFANVIHPASARFWAYLSSVVSLALGVYIVISFPMSALWVPGTLLGIEFIFNGTGLTGLAFAVRKMYREAHGVTGSWHPTHQPT